MLKEFQIFNYIDELDCFVVNPEYKKIANNLGLNEWNEVVWIGRFLSLDNDFGEHWFDNWKERDDIQEKAETLAISYDDLMIINPERFKNDQDGPTHNDAERKEFWTDVLKSLKLSSKILFAEARKLNSEREQDDEEYISDLEARISDVENVS